MDEAVVGVAEEDETRRASRGDGREKGGYGRKERVEEERLYRQAEGFNGQRRRSTRGFCSSQSPFEGQRKQDDYSTRLAGTGDFKHVGSACFRPGVACTVLLSSIIFIVDA